MTLEITITDPDRNLDFLLALDCTFQPGLRPRRGWRDGGDPGEAPFLEVDRARCLEVVVACGKNGVSAVPGLSSDLRLESQIGRWCLEQYADEIDRALRERMPPFPERVAV